MKPYDFPIPTIIISTIVLNDYYVQNFAGIIGISLAITVCWYEKVTIKTKYRLLLFFRNCVNFIIIK